MTTKGFHLTPAEVFPLDFSASTLDELTGRLSEGFYTTFSTLAQGTRVLGLRAHLERLYLPAREMGLRPSVDEDALRQHIADLVRENLPGESRLRLILTRDRGEVYVGIQPFESLPESVHHEGVHVITSAVARTDPRIKSTKFISQSAGQRRLVKGDIFEVLLTKSGKILEGMTSNFYAVRHVNDEAILVTAQRGILLGVTRRIVLRLARGEGIPIEFRAPSVDEKFDEAFLTSSSRGVIPVVLIDGKPVGEGKVEVWAKTLRKAYQAYVEARSESIV